MLAAWMRMWYPALVNGAVASSAPIGCVAPSYNTSSYWAVVTRDAEQNGGCSNDAHAIFDDLRELLKSNRDLVKQSLKLCDPLLKTSDDEALLQWVQGSFDLMAMGDYPFPTSYIAGTPAHPAPAWPMRIACKKLSEQQSVSPLEALLQAINVVRNTSSNVPCHDIHQKLSRSWLTWDFMVCTEAAIHEQPFFSAVGPPNDMFWPQKVYDHHVMDEYCMKHFGEKPRYGPLNDSLGPDAARASSNIVFANGLLDPWHSCGILQNTTERDIIAFIIPDGAHHLDLFFPTQDDPSDVLWVRQRQLQLVKKWLR